MRINHVLVDYENVQPRDLALLKEGPFRIKVFLGPHQAKVPVALAAAMQVHGANAEYVPLETIGTNALDFHIAYYIGVLSNREPSAFFHVISKDSGFDPLIRHLKGKGIFAQRSSSIAEMPVFQRATKSETGDRVEATIAGLAKRKSSKPKSRKTLLSTINAQHGGQLDEHQLAGILAALCRRGVVRLDGDDITYLLPE